MNKKIAVFSTTWSAEFSGGILKGMEDKIHETGDDLYVFNNYVGYESDRDFNRCEYNIFNLPVLEEYDGVLVLSNNVASAELLVPFYEKLNKSGVPCICIEQEVEGFHYIGTNNYDAMYELVEHVVTEHGSKIFNYIGGPKDNPENIDREKAFRDVLKKYQIDVDENRIKYTNFTQTNCKVVYDELADAGYDKADAVVCANDELAIAYIQKAKARGISVPGDMIVTGFDDTFIAKGFFPGITSVGRSKEELGRASIEQLLGMIDGKQYPMRVYQKHSFSPNESCGCVLSKELIEEIEYSKMNQIRHGNFSRWSINQIQKHLLVCRDEKDLKNALYYTVIPFNVEHFGIFLMPFWDGKVILSDEEELRNKQGYSDTMEIFAMKWYKDYNKHPIQQTRYVVPEGFSDPNKKGHFYIISPIHFNGINFGYLVIEDGLRFLMDNNLFYAVSVLDTAFDNLRHNLKIKELNNQLSQMYIQDSMTGLYNRFALKMIGEPLFIENREKNNNTLFLFADMDHLKSINDTYGHDSGDEAIIKISNVLKEACPDPSYFCIRYGGDEFLMIGTCRNDEEATAILNNVREKIDDINASKEIDYNLSISMGYILASYQEEVMSMDDYIKQADAMMYQMKKEKK